VSLSLIVTACGGSSGSHAAQLGSTTTTTQSSSSTTTAAGSSQKNGLASALAFARCMRSHAVPNFPDPDNQGDFPPFQTGVSKQTSTAANDACKHLIPSGGGGGAETQADQQKLAFALKVAPCMRSHGFPTYPDPTTSSQGSGTRFEGTGIDTKSPLFQAAETKCEQQARQALGLP
jgi:hypothetical protein